MSYPVSSVFNNLHKRYICQEFCRFWQWVKKTHWLVKFHFVQQILNKSSEYPKTIIWDVKLLDLSADSSQGLDKITGDNSIYTKMVSGTQFEILAWTKPTV